jgi:hypothetical protein
MAIEMYLLYPEMKILKKKEEMKRSFPHLQKPFLMLRKIVRAIPAPCLQLNTFNLG